MRKMVLALLGLGGILALNNPANAVLVESTWTFDIPTSSTPPSSATFTSSPDNKQLKVFAFSVLDQAPHTSPHGFAGGVATTLTFNGSGVGVSSAAGDDPNVDNLGAFDFLVFQLPTADWLPISMSFIINQLSPPNVDSPDFDDYEIYGSNALMDLDNGIYSTNLTMIYNGPNSGYPLTPIDLQNDTDGLLVTVNTPFQYIFVSGVTDNNNPQSRNNDDFFIASFTGAVDVPEPGTFALLGLGLVGMGGAAVRRRRTT